VNNFATVFNSQGNLLAPSVDDGEDLFQVTNLPANTTFSFRVGASLNRQVTYSIGGQSATTDPTPGPDGLGPL
jgi:hypothetical protein